MAGLHNDHSDEISFFDCSLKCSLGAGTARMGNIRQTTKNTGQRASASFITSDVLIQPVPNGLVLARGLSYFEITYIHKFRTPESGGEAYSIKYHVNQRLFRGLPDRFHARSQSQRPNRFSGLLGLLREVFLQLPFFTVRVPRASGKGSFLVYDLLAKVSGICG